MFKRIDFIGEEIFDIQFTRLGSVKVLRQQVGGERFVIYNNSYTKF